MFNKALRLACVLMFAAIAAGCASTKVVDGSASYVAPSFSAASIKQDGLAILPVVAGSGVEGYRRPFGDALNDAGTEAFGSQAKRWQETMQELNTAGLVDDYQQAINSYETTGIISSEIAGRMAEAVGKRYFLFVKLDPPIAESKKSYSVLAGSSSVTTKYGVTALGRVWDAKGNIVWEGVGGSTAEANSGGFQLASKEDKDLGLHSQKAATALLEAVAQ